MQASGALTVLKRTPRTRVRRRASGAARRPLALLSSLVVPLLLGACEYAYPLPPAVTSPYLRLAEPIADRAALVEQADWSTALQRRVTMVEHTFAPPELVFRENVPYTLVIVNAGDRPHTFRAPDFFRAVAVREIGSLPLNDMGIPPTEDVPPLSLAPGIGLLRLQVKQLEVPAAPPDEDSDADGEANPFDAADEGNDGDGDDAAPANPFAAPAKDDAAAPANPFAAQPDTATPAPTVAPPAAAARAPVAENETAAPAGAEEAPAPVLPPPIGPVAVASGKAPEAAAEAAAAMAPTALRWAVPDPAALALALERGLIEIPARRAKVLRFVAGRKGTYLVNTVSLLDNVSGMYARIIVE